jgi:hypothetical protein
MPYIENSTSLLLEEVGKELDFFLSNFYFVAYCLGDAKYSINTHHVYAIFNFSGHWLKHIICILVFRL